MAIVENLVTGEKGELGGAAKWVQPFNLRTIGGPVNAPGPPANLGLEWLASATSTRMARMKKATPSPRKSRAATKRRPAPKTVDGYLARVPEPARSTLETVRATIRSALPPEATEVLSYRMPAFRH